ncbi:golgi membrane protein-like protein [Pseudovirgaria hyperparasitica]|uniref:Protein YIP n=1 Tax=Pseudovirgaria hyperparasitica TaxID=470096 RepID=A0A6A6WGU7_9PEZI|nr:golgi membrane protein-like protein [Pseudovirgaria hyperparasitica]KAF2761196.1 golgi membrane protein-like protein [Pseudovirgaria hyperparasitica]
MASYGYPQQPAQGGYGAQNLQFYPSSYGTQPVSGHSTPFQAYNGGAQSQAFGGAGFGSGFGGQPGVSGRMGEQGGLRTGWLAAFGTEGYDGEPPLLEELGVNFGHIKTKTLVVLNPFGRIDQHIMDDSDLAGPILSFLLFGTFLLLSGKVHFGYIYGLALLGSISLHAVLSLMSPPLSAAEEASAQGHHHSSSHFQSTLTFPRSASVLGYCLLPLVIISLIGIAIPMDGMFGYILTSLAIAWSTYSSSAMFCAVGRMSGMRGLVAYPLALFYVGFGIMSIFSSRGTGPISAASSS